MQLSQVNVRFRGLFYSDSVTALLVFFDCERGRMCAYLLVIQLWCGALGKLGTQLSFDGTVSRILVRYFNKIGKGSTQFSHLSVGRHLLKCFDSVRCAYLKILQIVNLQNC